MDKMFDHICRIVASPIPRRRAFRMIAGALTGSALISWDVRPASAVQCPPDFGRDGVCDTLEQCCHDADIGFCCDDNQGGPACCTSAGNCCPTVTQCCMIGGTRGCCPKNAAGVPQECCQGLAGVPFCCPADKPACCGLPLITGAACCPKISQCCNLPLMGNICCPGDCCDIGGLICCSEEAPNCCPDNLGFAGFCCPPTKPICCYEGFGFCCPPHLPKCCSGVRDGMPIEMCCEADDVCDNGICGRVAYDFRGGGKFLNGRMVCTLRVALSGTADSGNMSSFSDASNISGSLRAYNYATRKLVESISFSSLEGMLFGGGDFLAMGAGTANVNGTVTNIDVLADKFSGVISFEVRNADTGAVLTSGAGEAGRSSLTLTTTFTPSA